MIATPSRRDRPFPPPPGRRTARLPAIRRAARPVLAAWLIALLAACSTTSRVGGPGNVSRLPPGNSQRDGPEANPPPNLEAVPDAIPQLEPIRIGGPNKPYEIDGRTYTPLTDDRAVAEKGLASWYGKKFHGRRTASGEAYNMYAMTAAHKTLPIPSYARVRNPANGHEVVVRVNDRGPFSAGRVIDLSYTAALKLGVLNGVQPVEIERITAEDIRSGAAFRHGPTYAAAPAVVAVGDVERGSISPLDDRGNPGARTVRGPVPKPAPRSRPPAAGDVVVAAAQPAAGLAGKVLSGTGSVAAAAAVGTVDLGAAAATDDAPAVAGTVTSVTTGPAVATEPAPAVPAGVVLPPPSTAAPADPPAVTATTTGREPRDERGRAETTAGAGWWVQLGAYRDRNGALDFQRRLLDEQPWLAPLLAVFNDRGMNKLQAGPYPSRDDARSAAERIRTALQLVPTIVDKR
jgi:rare lipoprotein A